jgi:uncharacterized membrane protein YkvA (DUF1232 family)
VNSILPHWRTAAHRLKLEVYTLYLAYRDPRTPLYARIFAACVVAYAFSPIDLIPDLIPVLGYLDDLALIPLGVYLALKMIPAPVMIDSRRQAREVMDAGKPVSRAAGVVIILLWLLVAGVFAWWMLRSGWVDRFLAVQ